MFILNIIIEVDIKRLGSVKGDAHNRDKWRTLTTGICSTLLQCGNEAVILYGLCSRDIKR